MFGLATIFFEDSTFTYTDGAVIKSEGKWKFSPDKKYIILKSTITPTITKDGIVHIPVNDILRIKKEKLVDCNHKFIYHLSNVATNAPR